MTEAIVREIELRAKYLNENDGKRPVIDSIYFGGGTPSLLNDVELQLIFSELQKQFQFSPTIECTLEANPDDLTHEKLQELANSPVNRLSIGIQSFDDADLKYMNRAHNAQEALQCISWAKEAGFDAISIDLIYGTPGLSNDRWKSQLERFKEMDLPHLSSYCLTVEENTALHHQIKTGKSAPVDDVAAEEHFKILMQWAKENGYEHYEISNLCKPGHRAVHNSSYWKSKSYLGVGPSAHSFNGESREWNVANNAKYIKAIQQDELPSKKEMLTKSQHFNEVVMTSLRTIWGIDLKVIETRFGPTFYAHLLLEARHAIASDLVRLDRNMMCLTDAGRLVADRISSDLFIVE